MSSAVGVSLPRLSRSTTTTREILKYAVDGKVPGFTADFIDNYYSGHTSLSSAITHSRSGNAVMTDGYGPELVVNGGFDSGTDGWTTSGNVTVEDGVATLDGSSTTLLWQSILTIGKMYEVNFDVVSVGGGSLELIDNGGTAYDTFNTTGPKKLLIEASGSNSNLLWRTRNNAIASIDNVSVREMPVLKWAPHNLFTESENMTASIWATGSNATKSSYSVETPDGGSTAIRVQLQALGSSYLRHQLTLIEGVTYTIACFVKATTSNSDFTFFGGGAGHSSIFTATSEWQLFEYTFTADATTINHGIGNDNDTFSSDILVWGAHLYRSDLGGMVGNPDQPASRASYVPTTSSAVYLPRVGHHVFNGSAWVNEGLLAESEARTNLELYSDFASSILVNNLTVSTNQAVSPDGTQNATELTETGANNYHRVYQDTNKTGTANSDHTFSAYVKRGSGTRDIQLRAFYLGTGAPYVNFDLGDGTVGSSSGASGTSASSHTWTLTNTNIQDVGNDWYRVSATVNASSDFTVGFVLIDDASTAIELEVYQGDNTSSVLIYGAQFEKGSTPSSLIPTSGSDVTRPAETFTIPSANLPWPEPNYIGSELVTNGTFDTDVSGWTADSDGTISYSNGTLLYTGTSTGPTFMTVQQDGIFTAGKLYRIGVDLVTSSDTSNEIRLRSNTTSEIGDMTATGSYEFFFLATGSDSYLRMGIVGGLAGESFSIDNVSVREIDPLSVSIAMDGRVTYADEGAASTAVSVYWAEDSSNYIRHRLRTDSAKTGEIQFNQAVLGTSDGVSTANDYLTPDILVPFNIASRHGSTFINGATDGVALTANTTPTALPDLSATDLSLAYDYMGTLKTFRVWDRDLGDDGIVEATNPSLEPSLSLTFEGTGTNSFVVNNWSE